MNWETVWTFDTANYRVGLQVTPEVEDPGDFFDDPQIIQEIRDGRWEWFTARVVVTDKEGTLLGTDYLGACSYESPLAFREDGGYFPDMVRTATAEARSNVRVRLQNYSALANALRPNA